MCTVTLCSKDQKFSGIASRIQVLWEMQPVNKPIKCRIIHEAGEAEASGPGPR